MSADVPLWPARELTPPRRNLVPAVAWGAPMANPLADLYAARRVGEAAGVVVITACGRDGGVSPTEITLRVN